MNILFTCAGRRNYLINYFKKAIGTDGKIFAADMDLSAPAMIDADVPLLVPSIYDENYIEALKTIIKIHSIKAIISLNDLELPILSKHKNELETFGVKVLVSNEDVIDITFDKLKTFNFIKNIGLETPQTYTKLEAVKIALKNNQIQFPLVLKPRWGSASIGLSFPESMEELELAFKLLELKLKKSELTTVSSKNSNDAILIQEKIDGIEYGMDIVNNFENAYFGTFVREKLSMRGGETDKAVSVIDEQFQKLGSQLSNQLKHLGSLDCDVILSKNKIYIIECNPRFGGGYPFSHEAGINIAAIYIEWLKGNTNVNHFNNYVSGRVFSKCDRIINIS